VAFVFCSRPVYRRFPYQEGPFEELIERYGTWVRDIALVVKQMGYEVEVHVPLRVSHSRLSYQGIDWFFHRDWSPSDRLGMNLPPTLFLSLLRRPPGILHLQGLGWVPLSFLLLLFGKLLRCAIVAHHHGERIIYRHPVAHFMVSRIIRSSEAVICLTEGLRGLIKERWQREAFVLPGFVKGVFRPLRLPRSRLRSIVVPGEVIPRKGQLVAARALGVIHRSFPGVRLWLAGAPSDLAYVAQIKRVAGRWVHFLGHLPPSRLAVVLNKAHLAVFPSRQEGFGLAPVESMACGTPTLLSRIPRFRGSAGYCPPAGLFDCEDHMALAELSLEVLREDEEAQSSRQACFGLHICKSSSES